MKKNDESAKYMFDKIDLTPVIKLLKTGDISEWYKSSDGGKYLQGFQKLFANYCCTKYAFATSSGSSAIYVALKAIGVKKGDEVVVPSYTHVGDVAPIVLAGARPYFVDIDKFGNLDPSELHSIPFDTKAVIVVHQLGMPANMPEIQEKINIHTKGARIIEDASHALGAECLTKKGWQRAGSIGDIGCFSVGGGRTKTIATGEGGMITTSNETFAEKCKNIRNHGDRYTDCDYFCFNFRLSELNALLGFLQMPKLDALNRLQIHHAQYLMRKLPHYIEVPKTPAYVKPTHYIVGGLFSTEKAGMTRDEFLRELSQKGYDGGIPRKNVSGGYSKLISDIKYYRRFYKRRLPMSEKLRDEAIWMDWHRFPRTQKEIDILLEHFKEVCP